MSVIHLPGLTAVWRRQLGSLLGNPLGYIFILAFVLVASGFLFLPDSFYSRNICDLGPLWSNEGSHPPIMPLLLAILLPALAMGAWASERDQGTEEMLLTMPLSIFDAVTGKYLAVASYFSIALFCSLSAVCVLFWLGNPDAGLLFANFLGWWLAGLVFAAWGLLASVMVSMPAIAFVLGAVFCAAALLGATAIDWFDDFNRGVIAVEAIVVAAAAIATGLGLSILLLASRRWRPSMEKIITAHILSMIFALVLSINLARIAQRHQVDADVSVEGLSSMSAESAAILKNIERPVIVSAFISQTLPDDLKPKQKEVEDKLKALKRLGGEKVTVQIFRPEDSLDQYALLATRDYNLKPRKAIEDTVSGKEQQDVFLGAAVTSGGSSQIIEYFDPGLSVEYELVRAVRTVASSKKRVLGVAKTDLEMLQSFDFRTYQSKPEWQVIAEWKRQYEVREVNLDSPVTVDVEVLVVPQVSTLSDAQLLNLHDWIWNGGPTLILEDPLPMFGGPNLAISQPKKSEANPYGGQEPDAPKKGDIKPLIKALGIQFDPNNIVWSDYNPSHEFRASLPKSFVWVRRDQGGILDNLVTAGIDSILMPFPGGIREASDKYPTLKVETLIRPSTDAAWGQHPFSEHVGSGMMGGLQQKQPSRYTPSDRNRLPAVAVEITGTMPSAYPKPDPSAKPVEEKKDEAEKPADETAAKEGEEKTDEAKKEDGVPAVPEKTGVPSPKPIHVIVVADNDFAHDAFFQFYRNPDKNFSKDELKFLLALRNVQFAGNAVDALASDQDFLKLRTRSVQNRPLLRMEKVNLDTQDKLTQDTEHAMSQAQAKVDEAQAAFAQRLNAIDSQEDIDETTKAHLKAQTQEIGQRLVDVEIQRINKDRESAIHVAKIEQRRIISSHRAWVRRMALGIPSVLLAGLIFAVFLNRLSRERSHIPASRKRSAV
jgi:ABC-2 type transport system permease protein